MDLPDADRNTGQGRGQDAKNISPKRMGVYDIGLVSAEQMGQLPDSHRIPVSFARQKMDMHTELGKLVKKNAFVFVGDHMHVVPVCEQWQQRAQTALHTPDFEVVGDPEQYGASGGRRGHEVFLRALSWGA